MDRKEIGKNLLFTTLPVCIVIFFIVWLLAGNVILASVIPLIIFAASFYSNLNKYSYDIKQEEAGVTKHKFKSNKVYELLAPDDSVSPSLCFDIDENHYLLMNGQWIYDEKIYGEDAEQYYDNESSIFNCYEKPYSFPAKEFEIWISNLDSRPIKIVVLGEYLQPESKSWPTPTSYMSKQFSIITKDELQEV